MATSHFGLLEEREELELHKGRLLRNEEKYFQRVKERLLTPGKITNPKTGKFPTPPPETLKDAKERLQEEEKPVSVEQFIEDVKLDFEVFDSFIARLQFLNKSNEAERERYAADRVRILDTMDTVRQSNAELHVRLEEAKATLARRRRFDELADKITANRMLRPRGEQHVNLARLADECEELRRESATYGGTWKERKEQFDKLVDEGKRLRALIRDEKEEVERREGMDSDAEDGQTGPANTGGAVTNSNSASATPGAAARNGTASGNVTPRPESGARADGATPRPDSPSGSLKPGESFSRAGSQAPSINGGHGGQTPQQQTQETGELEEGEEGEDVSMDEPSQTQTQTQTQREFDTPMGGEDGTAETPQITVDAPATEDKMDTT